MSIYNSTYFLDFVNIKYSDFINSDIIIFTNTDMLPSQLTCKFIDYQNTIPINFSPNKLLCRKPINITVKNNDTLITIRKDQYYLVLSKQLLDLFTKIMNKNNIPKEIEFKIEEFIPEYCKLF